MIVKFFSVKIIHIRVVDTSLMNENENIILMFLIEIR